MVIEKTKVNWVVLAGGQASRMGGQDKGLIIFNNKPLIAHITDILRPQVASLMINANRNIDAYQQYAPTFEDDKSGNMGPLAGIHSALLHSQGFDWVGVVPCDSPNLPDDYVSHFLAQDTQGAEILVAFDGNRIQPVFAMYHQSVLSKLEAFLHNGDRKIQLFFKNCVIKHVDFKDCPQMFINLNTPDDLKLHSHQ